jgi:hypothetical protein
MNTAQVLARVVTAETSFTRKTVGYSDSDRNEEIKREVQVPQTT